MWANSFGDIVLLSWYTVLHAVTASPQVRYVYRKLLETTQYFAQLTCAPGAGG